MFYFASDEQILKLLESNLAGVNDHEGKRSLFTCQQQQQQHCGKGVDDYRVKLSQLYEGEKKWMKLLHVQEAMNSNSNHSQEVSAVENVEEKLKSL